MSAAQGKPEWPLLLVLPLVLLRWEEEEGVWQPLVLLLRREEEEPAWQQLQGAEAAARSVLRAPAAAGPAAAAGAGRHCLCCCLRLQPVLALAVWVSEACSQEPGRVLLLRSHYYYYYYY